MMYAGMHMRVNGVYSSKVFQAVEEGTHSGINLAKSVEGVNTYYWVWTNIGWLCVIHYTALEKDPGMVAVALRIRSTPEDAWDEFTAKVRTARSRVGGILGADLPERVELCARD